MDDVDRVSEQDTLQKWHEQYGRVSRLSSSKGSGSFAMKSSVASRRNSTLADNLNSQHLSDEFLREVQGQKSPSTEDRSWSLLRSTQSLNLDENGVPSRNAAYS